LNHKIIVVEEQSPSANVDVQSEHLNLGSVTIKGDTTQHLEHIVTNCSPPPAPTVNRILDVSQNSFSMPLTNVIDIVAIPTIVVYEPVITLS
jgi:hypothetical protein